MAKEKSFEELFQRLEEIVREMESEDLQLEKSLTLFEEGVKLSEQLRGQLSGAEQKISELMDKLGKDK
ncbi:MAG: exodeoxyribonuclease VII small subunit [Candidatus Marinimicrobia bacterium]|jgi:exodeoxyribonuclease VII small subunit|nr:exodeoxyribonuclease VII small subunit [Candidatus Neomarinimicrobiota bacterium]MDP6500775.1 exodeoxyribonuclease VII small subunit [Candidatus Neomarinimicrobiota bacterium]MDP6725815.1 exodeoxyribonuclease VII small subunit [Candidatus Neomarinimicrobiota bacterium]MDP7095377.1 exodeoxyribonuclease VII small subunit [Candidatus Neomarinimicrobiota bacterium]MDP7165476.1 exodeoxyribonuclease VII small subunit [Candidatus Neomarinimicrobiota bacterium]|tara:strand:+ start:72 stop:275 length:204 start_codon:yes stop_codon:yes gene_type:complete